MSDTFEFVSQGGINFKAFPSRIKFTFLVKDNYIGAHELIVKLSPIQARELAGRLLAFAEQEEPTDRFTVELTEDEIDQCVHAINELCEAFIKDGYPISDVGIQSYINTARKLDEVFTRPVVDTDRFAMGTPSVDHAGENKEGDL